MLFRGGTIVEAQGVRRADVRVADGRIVEVGAELRPDADRVADVGGLHLFPGAVDPHVHQWEPGFASAPDFADATSSAAVGGVTTLIDHPLTPPVVIDAERFAEKIALGERTAVIDFALHGGLDPGSLDALPALWAAGAAGIKLFTCATGGELGSFEDVESLRVAFGRLASVGALGLVHAEDASTLDRNREALRARGTIDVAAYGAWHSLDAEVSAVERVLEIAEHTQARLYLVHASHPDVVDRVRAASRGRRSVWVETCPHYLQLDEADLPLLGGGRGLTAPPVRDRAARSALVARLADGRIDALGSDHCAVSAAGKDVGRIDQLVPGVPGLDLYLPLVLDVAIRNGIPLSRVAETTASAPARIFGLRSKGSIEVGRDADLAIVDVDATVNVRARDLASAAGWTPYEGRRLRGVVLETWSRAELIARDGEVVGRPGRGRFIGRQEEA